MAVYLCSVCNVYYYNEETGDPKTDLPPGTKWEEIPETWRCPICEAKKEALKKLDDQETVAYLESEKTPQIEPSTPIQYLTTLAEVRENALPKLAGICAVNRICDGNPDRLCMGQKYGERMGLGGAGKGKAFTENILALDSIKLKPRLIKEHTEPNTSMEIYGTKIDIPIMASSMSGVKASMGGKISEENFAFAVLQGSKDAGTIGWIGNTSDEGKELVGVESIKSVGLGIPIFKPQSNERLLILLKLAEDMGSTAVGVDLDGVGSMNWFRAGKPLFRKSVDELKELVDSTKLPFIAKGIMTVEDALDAVDAGVSGIDVSNHGGRVLDSTRGVAEVLPEIVKAVDGKVTVTAGGGIRTGFDVLKILASGADAALIGRDIIRAALGGGATGVKLHFEYLTNELWQGMVMTGCGTVEDIDGKILVNNE